MVTRLSRKFRLFAVMALILSFVLPQAAVLAEEPPVLGTNSFAGDGSTQTHDATMTDDVTSTSVIADPLRRFTGLSVQGGYVAAGTAMRNRGYGTIELTGIPAGSKIVAAYLYWDVLANFASDSLARGRIMPDPGGVFGRIPSSGLPLGFPIQGTPIGTGGDPCWGNMHNFAYRADVKKLVFGNGRYQLSGFASGVTDGRDPWIQGSQAPMLEGASLVVIYSNPSSQPTQVMIYEGSDLVAGSSTQTIDGFDTASVSHARTTFIGADGQDAPEQDSLFNGQPLPEVRWDGNDPQSGPNFSQGNLWDTMTVDVTDLVPHGRNSATVTVGGGSDCLVWVAQVLSVSGPDVALLAPVPEGVKITEVRHGYNDPEPGNKPRNNCDIKTASDHCQNQKFGLDLVPDSTWDRTILAPAPGTPVTPTGGFGGDCLLFRLDDNTNVNICHFAFIRSELLGHHVPRGTVLGKSTAQPIHLSLDKRWMEVNAGQFIQIPLNAQYASRLCHEPYGPGEDKRFWCPQQFVSPYTLEKQNLVWNGTTSDQRFEETIPITSTNKKAQEHRRSPFSR